MASNPALDTVPPPEAARSADRAVHGVDALRLLVMLCVSVPLLLFVGFGVYRYQQVLSEAEVRLQRSLGIAHEHALRVLDVNDALVQQALEITRDVDGVALLGERAQIERRLQEFTRGKPQVHTIRVLDASGRTVVASPRQPADEDLSGRDFFRWHRDNAGDGLYVTELLTGRSPAERYFELSRARRDPSGNFDGVVTVGLDSGYFTQFHQQLADEEPGLAITLFRQDGTVFSRWPQLPGVSAPQRMSSQGEVLARVLRGEQAGTVRNISSLDGQRRIILFRKLGSYPIYIGTGREFGAIRAALLSELAMLAAAGFIPVLGIIVTAWLAMRRTQDALRAARRLEKETVARRNVEEALLQAQKMEALGRLTGGVAHDFNNALMVVSGNLHLLRRVHPEVSPRYTDAMGRAIESATQLTRQLLAFTRRQALAPQTIALQDWLPAIKDLLTPTLGSQVMLQIAVASDTPPLHIDVAELELALINLAVNARDAMPEGGEFRMRAFGEDSDESNRQEPRRWVVLEATDSGTGMDEQTAAKAFEPFFTTKPLGKGTGLGLSQVYALCNRAGGDVHLISSIGGGTTVRMRFPRSTALPPLARPEHRPSGRLGLRVLLAEDNPEVAAVVHPVLENLGCTVVHVGTGDLALERLETGERFDLLLSDVVMPGALDGAALARKVQQRWPQMPVLLMTGYAEQMQAIAAMRLDVLPKPFTPEALADALAKYAEPRLQKSQTAPAA